jgi:hypothetical protein
LAKVVNHVQQRLLQATESDVLALSLQDQKELHSSIEKARLEQKSAAAEYQLAQTKAYDLQQMWMTEWTNALVQFQKLEVDRIEFLKATFWAYANMLSVVGVAEDDGCERIRTDLEKVDVERDLTDFVAQYGTGHRDVSPLASPVSLSPVRPVEFSDKIPIVTVAIPDSGNLTTKQLQENHKKRVIKEEARVFVPPRTNSGQQTPVQEQVQVIPIRSNSGKPETGFAPRLSSLKPVSEVPVSKASESKVQVPQETVIAESIEPMTVPPRNLSQRKSLGRKKSPKPPTPNPEQSPDDFMEEETYDPYDLISKPILCWVKVLYPYSSSAFEELDIERDDVFPVVGKQEDGWWEGEVDDGTGKLRRGLFPSNFVSIIPSFEKSENG